MDFDDIPQAEDEQIVVLEPAFDELPPPIPRVEDSFLPDPDPIEEDALTYGKSAHDV